MNKGIMDDKVIQFHVSGDDSKCAHEGNTWISRVQSLAEL